MRTGALLTLSPDIVTNEIATATRWQKLYRTIFHLFLKKDFVHLKDFKLYETQMNARLKALEVAIAAGDAAVAAGAATTSTTISASLASHIHIAPQAPAGALPTTPPTPLPPPIPPVPPAPGPATPEVNVQDTFAQQQDVVQQAMGPSAAPLGQGISLEVQQARVDVQSDIGLV